MSKADVNDISLRIKSLHREILQLKRTQELIQANENKRKNLLYYIGQTVI